MKPDTKPQLGPAGIAANIAHLEARVQTAHDSWQQELNQLQYWLEKQAQLEYEEITNGVE